jgi:hypothetical protein
MYQNGLVLFAYEFNYINLFLRYGKALSNKLHRYFYNSHNIII